MEEKYWNRFVETGNIADYLAYCKETEYKAKKGNVTEKADEKVGRGSGEPKYGIGNGDFYRSDWGI